MKQPLKHIRAAVVLVAFVGLLFASVSAGAAGPFDTLFGSWKGIGQVNIKNSGPERIKCNAKYSPQGNSSLSVHLACASDSYNVKANAIVRSEGGVLSGSWTESTNGVSDGTLTGSIRGATISADLRSGSYVLPISIWTGGKDQKITFTTPTNSVESIFIPLRKQ